MAVSNKHQCDEFHSLTCSRRTQSGHETLECVVLDIQTFEFVENFVKIYIYLLFELSEKNYSFFVDIFFYLFFERKNRLNNILIIFERV